MFVKKAHQVLSQQKTTGGKSWNLAFLSRHKLPVPPWFCITTDAFQHFIDPCLPKLLKIADRLDYTNPGAVNKAYSAIRQCLESQEVAARITGEIMNAVEAMGHNRYFAVRSSASGEDSSSHSFAGMFTTCLHVPAAQICHFVKQCWIASFNTNALIYLAENNLSLRDIHMAVIVQEMVDSRKSGVLFQANPMGKLEETVIVAGYGLGEGIVGDQVETDTYYYNHILKQTRKIINCKKYAMRFDAELGYGVKKLALEAEAGAAPVLAEEEIVQLLNLSAEVEKIYDHYQDLEWAFDADSRLFITQSRPITTIPGGEIHYYDNSNIIESYPGISSNLTYCVIKKAYKHNFKNSFRKMGIFKSLLDKTDGWFSELVELIQGRFYYRFTNWHRMFSLLPLGTKLFVPYMEDMLGVEAHRVKTGERISVIMRFFSKMNAVMVLCWKSLWWKRYMEKYNLEFPGLYAGFRERAGNAAYNSELIKIYTEFRDRMLEAINIPLINDIMLSLFMGLAKDLIRRFCPGIKDSDRIINGLLVGEKGMESVKPVQSIMQLADIVRSSGELEQLLTGLGGNGQWQSLAGSFPQFYSKFSEHIEKYGDRGIGELKLETPGFRQQPLKLVKVILNYASTTLTREEMEQREAALRSQAEQELDSALCRFPARKRLLDSVVRKVRELIRNREKSRFDRSRVVGVMREIFIRIGTNWVNAGVLGAVNEIFYFTDDEIAGFVQEPGIPDLAALLVQRKKTWEEYAENKPLDRMWLRGDAAANFIPQQAGENMAVNTDGLSGIGCCPGIVQGEAIVIRSADETINTKDKILVAENTDPGWVFLIQGAKGLIVEKGSLLSHTAIIGRELGIPTVVNVRQATARIRNGSCVKLDGTRGVVELI